MRYIIHLIIYIHSGFATEPIYNNYNLNEDNINIDDEASFLANLTSENVKQIRQQQKSKFMISSNNKIPNKNAMLLRSNSRHIRSNRNLNEDGAIDVFSMMVEFGIYDRQFLNSIKQLRQFKDNRNLNLKFL